MNLSNETIAILKNFAGINSNIKLQPGKVLKTLAPSKSVYAEANIDEEFAQEIGIWDLNKFLSTISLFKSPSFDFRDDYVRVNGAESSSVINYYYSDPSLLTNVPKAFKLPSCEVEFALTSQILHEMMKASSVLQLHDIAVFSEGNGVYLKLVDKKDSTTNSYEIKVSDTKTSNFIVYFKIDNMKMIPGNYTVKLSNKNVSEFAHENGKIRYYICTECDSKWN